MVSKILNTGIGRVCMGTLLDITQQTGINVHPWVHCRAQIQQTGIAMATSTISVLRGTNSASWLCCLLIRNNTTNYWSGNNTTNYWSGNNTTNYWSGNNTTNCWSGNNTTNYWSGNNTTNNRSRSYTANNWPGNNTTNNRLRNYTSNNWPGNHTSNYQILNKQCNELLPWHFRLISLRRNVITDGY